jgi:hypothetical protein
VKREMANNGGRREEESNIYRNNRRHRGERWKKAVCVPTQEE